jgi:uncharacterized integral membrane protein
MMNCASAASTSCCALDWRVSAIHVHEVHHINPEVTVKSHLIVALVVFVLVVIFAAQNSEVVPVKFLFWSVAMSRATLLFLVFAAGLGSGWLLRSFLHIRRRR